MVNPKSHAWDRINELGWRDASSLGKSRKFKNFGKSLSENVYFPANGCCKFQTEGSRRKGVGFWLERLQGPTLKYRKSILIEEAPGQVIPS